MAFLLQTLGLSMPEALGAMWAGGLSDVWVPDADSRSFWLKQLLAGAAIAVATTGLDREMMQKNIVVLTLIMVGVRRAGSAATRWGWNCCWSTGC